MAPLLLLMPRTRSLSLGGHVVVYRGMLRFAETQDRLAVILSHEIAHYLARMSREGTSS